MTNGIQFDLPSSLSAKLHGDIAVLRLSRPEKRNAIDLTMIHGIDRFFSELPVDVRAVVIRGEGITFLPVPIYLRSTKRTAPLAFLVRAPGIVPSSPGWST